MQFMEFKIEKLIKDRISSSSKIINKLIDDCSSQIFSASNIIKSSFLNKGKIFWCGNGGSASQAQHLSTEIIAGMNRHDLIPKSSICLNTDSIFLTAWSNDVGYDSIFSRQLQGIASKNDVLISISTSGNSKNIINAILEAKKIGMKTITMTAHGGSSNHVSLLSGAGNLGTSVATKIEWNSVGDSATLVYTGSTWELTSTPTASVT